MYEIKSMSYEECRAEHFKALMKKMERKINYWQDKKLHSLKPLSELSRANNECSEAGMQYSFYKDALEALAAAPKWISVEERLPENGERVLAVDADGYMMTGEITCILGDRHRKTVYYCDNGYVSLVDVTHWMKLPEAPKEVE